MVKQKRVTFHGPRADSEEPAEQQQPSLARRSSRISAMKKSLTRTSCTSRSTLRRSARIAQIIREKRIRQPVQKWLPTASKSRSKWVNPIKFGWKKGTLHVFGENSVGQLGIPVPDVDKEEFPAIVPSISNVKVIQVAAGAMHTVVLTADNKVITFGCNDEFALGRITATNEDMAKPHVVTMPEAILQVIAGDSYSAALSKGGSVYAFGTFRDSTGTIGLQPRIKMATKPIKIRFISKDIQPKIILLAGGVNHIVALTADNYVFTFGNGEFGQLGRWAGRHPRGNDCLKPGKITATPAEFVSIYAGSNSTYCEDSEGKIWACGINGCSQLGWPAIPIQGNYNHFTYLENCTFLPRISPGLSQPSLFDSITAGDKHLLALSDEGSVYSMGGSWEGSLGLGDDVMEVPEPTLVPGLPKCVEVCCGDSTSYAITHDGRLFAWGLGINSQLSTGETHDAAVPRLCRGSRTEEEIDGKVLYVSAGAQHTAIIIDSRQ